MFVVGCLLLLAVFFCSCSLFAVRRLLLFAVCLAVFVVVCGVVVVVCGVV